MLAILVMALGLAMEVANADFTFDEPTNLGPTVNSSADDGSLSISADVLALYVDSTRFGSLGGRDIWVATRETIGDDWGSPVNLGPTINSSYIDPSPDISGEGLALFFG